MKKISLNEMKEIELNILKEFVIFCEKNNLRYYIAYGTLLGAVRHQGFIPWDDDIDVVMPRPDYNRFLHLAQQGISEDYEVLSNDLFPWYIYPFAKVSDKNTLLIEPTTMKKGLGVYVDIFPLDGLPNAEKERGKYIKKMKFLSILLRLCVEDNCQGSNKMVSICKRCLHPCLHLIGHKRILRWIDKVERGYPWEDAEYVCNATDDIIRDYNPKRFYSDTIELTFETCHFRASVHYHDILNKYYGDYMILPAENERVAHSNVVYWKNT